MFKMFVAVTCLTAALAFAVVAGQEDTSDNDRRQARGMMFGWNMMEGGKRSCAGLKGRTGVCMDQNKCMEMNGKSVGRCFPFESCCSITPNSCGSYTGLSTSYFQNPDKFQEVCAYKINVRRNVCQIRIDFERFTLGQPTKPYNDSAYACENDEFTVFSNDNTKINMPVLCGENSGQHVYIPLNEQTSMDMNNRLQLTLKFRLANRDEDFSAPDPHWKMKISQLECQPTSTNWWKIKDIARQLWDKADEEEEEEEETERDASAGKQTKYSLAPDGCLQYFTDKEGSFESFNYNKGMGHYLGNLNYAVCFKRSTDTCGIKYKATKFQIAYNQKLSSATDRDCDTINEGQQTTTEMTTTTASMQSTTLQARSDLLSKSDYQPQPESENQFDSQSSRDARKNKWPSTVSDLHGDYLLVPDGVYSENKFASKFCDNSLESLNQITVKTQGPLYAAFVSDEYSNSDEDVEKGYKINYSLISTGC